MKLPNTMLQLKTRWNETSQKRILLWVVAVIFSGLLAFYWDATRDHLPADPHARDDQESAATFIPAGFVLVPIEVANYESLDSILGKFGVVDLYLPALEAGARSRKVAERVKILRAPLNPSHFAVLVAEDESPRLVMHPGPFTVVVQNPKNSGTHFVNRQSDRQPDGQSDGVVQPERPTDDRKKRKLLKKKTPHIIVETTDAQ